MDYGKLRISQERGGGAFTVCSHLLREGGGVKLGLRVVYEDRRLSDDALVLPVVF